MNDAVGASSCHLHLTRTVVGQGLSARKVVCSCTPRCQARDAGVCDRQALHSYMVHAAARLRSYSRGLLT